MSTTLILILLILTTIVVLFACALATIIFSILLYTKVPFVRTPKKVIAKILKEIPINKKQTVYDLGCGDASVLIAIEKETGAKTVGFEITPIAFYLGKFNIWRNKAKTTILYKNFYKQNLAPADVVFCFLIDKVMFRVGNQLRQQLRPGARVISFGFHIPDWQPVKTIVAYPERKTSSKIYLYQI